MPPSALLRFILCLILMATGLQARTWISHSGKTLEGTWVKSNNRTITLRLDSGKTTTFKLSLLSEADQKHAGKLAADNIHPLGWKPLTIKLDEAQARISAIGMANTFRRTGAREWQATLPTGTWIEIRIGSRYRYDRTHLFSWDGSTELAFTRDKNKLFLSSDGKAKRLVSLVVRNLVQHDKEAQKELKKYKDLDSLDISHTQNYGLDVFQQLNPKAVHLHGMSFTDETYQQLAKLPRLRAISAHSRVKNSKAIHLLNHLEALKTEEGLSSSNQDLLSGLSQLRQLQTIKGSTVKSTHWLKALKNLRALNLGYSNSSDADALTRALPQLHSYSPGSSDTHTAEYIARMTQLCHLGYWSLPKDQDPSPVFALKNLTFCYFSHTMEAETLNRWRASGGLNYLKEMEWFKNCGELHGFESLRHLKTQVEKAGDLDQFQQLESLSFRFSYKSNGKETIENTLHQQKQLQQLEISEAHLASLDEIPAMPQLRVLVMNNCRKLTSLKGNKKFPKLEIIILKGCKSVTDFDKLMENKKILVITDA